MWYSIVKRSGHMYTLRCCCIAEMMWTEGHTLAYLRSEMVDHVHVPPRQGECHVTNNVYQHLHVR